MIFAGFGGGSEAPREDVRITGWAIHSHEWDDEPTAWEMFRHELANALFWLRTDAKVYWRRRPSVLKYVDWESGMHAPKYVVRARIIAVLGDVEEPFAEQIEAEWWPVDRMGAFTPPT